MSLKRVFSGIQPTGFPHLGNYLGAIRNWVALQNQVGTDSNSVAKPLFCIVDLHALTTQPDAALLKKNVQDMAISLLACGLDPKKVVLFVQSEARSQDLQIIKE
jgi:tryptophanyl-tRNA synthetase